MKLPHTTMPTVPYPQSSTNWNIHVSPTRVTDEKTLAY